MYIRYSYDTDFERVLLDLRDKYPKKLFKLEGIDEKSMDVCEFAKQYYSASNVADSGVDPNANIQIKNAATFNTEQQKAINKLNSLYLLWKKARALYGGNEAKRLIERQIAKDIYINDLTHINLPYCIAFDCYDVAVTGLPFVANYPSEPPRHADTFMEHVIQLLQFSAPQLMGATAIPNFLIIYAGFLQQDSLDTSEPVPNYKQQPELFDRHLSQQLQKLIFLLNQPLRQVQSIFTNITIFDKDFLEEMCKRYVIKDVAIDPEFAQQIQVKFLEVLNSLNEKQLTTFPVVTAQFRKTDDNEIIDTDFLDLISTINLPFGHLNIYSDTSLTALSSCCRLLNNVEDIITATKEEHTNLIGGSSVKVGSFGVASMNLARIGIVSKTKEEYLKRVKLLATDIYKINHCRRKLIEGMIAKHQLPLYDHGFINLNTQYSTLGINGLEESLYFLGLGAGIATQEAKDFVKQVLNALTTESENAMRKYGYKCNIELIPGESAAVKFCEADNVLYGGGPYDLYSNQFLRLDSESTEVIERVKLQGEFEKYFSGGTILHINLGEKIESQTAMKKLISYIIKNGVKYFAINYFFQKCVEGHITVSSGEGCPQCGKPIKAQYTRVVGFITPVQSWGKVRREEQRKFYLVKELPNE